MDIVNFVEHYAVTKLLIECAVMNKGLQDRGGEMIGCYWAWFSMHKFDVVVTLGCFAEGSYHRPEGSYHSLWLTSACQVQYGILMNGCGFP